MTPEQAPDIREAVEEMIRKHRAWVTFEGVLFILIGIAAILFPVFSSIATEIFLGALFVVGGAVTGARVIAAKGMVHRGVSVLLSLTTIAGGIMLLVFVGQGLLALTLVLSAFFLARGVLDIVYGARIPAGRRGRGWMIFSGIVGVFVGLLIWTEWPSTAFWVLGTLAGIEFMVSGMAILSLAGAARDLVSNAADQG